MSKSVACLIIALNVGVIVFASAAYDSIECDPHSNRARTGRARLIESIPCDLTKQSYCNLPGDHYPWNAVKKFVYDNQGLVRRMYGDLRHIFVMQSELENEIDFEDIKHTADKYSKTFNMHNNQQRQARARKVNGERKNYRNGDTSEPHFRPANRPSAINRTKPPKATAADQSDKASLIDNIIQTNADSPLTTTTLDAKAKGVSQKTTKLTSVSPSSTTPESIKSTSETSSNDADDQHLSTEENEQKKNEIVDKAVLDLFSNISSALAAKSTTPLKVVTLSTTASTVATNESVTSEKPSISIKNKAPFNEEIQAESEEEEVPPATEKVDDKETSKDPSLAATTEAQLYQDAIVPTMNRRGVNACPVKEEVVAPFWGNNTRGEILALLNVYPFEQYINWEKCTHENQQMYCRKGCRCEQQYRLHRLLAYNPLDACRGIFSDWFRFPSCCICKCYDIPLDYRVTSRSPRGSDKVFEAEEDDEDLSIFEDDYSYFDPE